MNRKQDKYISKIAKKVKVNDVIFDSAKSASRYIVGLEPDKNVMTISKEIRRCINGLRPEWYMYGKYKIERV